MNAKYNNFKIKSYSSDNFEQDGIITLAKLYFCLYKYIYICFSDARNTEISLALYRKSLKSTESHSDGSHFDEEDPHVFVILGASVSFYITML